MTDIFAEHKLTTKRVIVGGCHIVGNKERGYDAPYKNKATAQRMAYIQTLGTNVGEGVFEMPDKCNGDYEAWKAAQEALVPK